LLHQLRISNYFMWKMHGQTTLKLANFVSHTYPLLPGCSSTIVINII